MAKRDYYEILGVNKNSSVEDIKSSYRKLAMKYHPDRNPGDKESEELFKEASEAYEVLSDTEKRRRYDQFGVEGLRGTDFRQYNNFDDIFSAFSDIFSGGSIFDEFFGGGNRRRSGSRRNVGEKGSDLRIRMPMTLEEISKGIEKNVKLKLWVVCNDCTGSGLKQGSSLSTCNRCNGTGEIRNVSRSMFGQFVNITACPTCNGSGQIISDPCTKCNGDGRVQGEDTVKVVIPAGVEEGNYLDLYAKAHAGKRGGPAGDLRVIIEEKEHKFFRRQNHNIIYHLTISYPQAALGAEIEVPTIYGNENIKISSGTQPGAVITLKDKGLPILNTNSRGNQIIYVNVYVPTTLNPKEKAILQELSLSENILVNNKASHKQKDFFEKVKDVFF